MLMAAVKSTIPVAPAPTQQHLKVVFLLWSSPPSTWHQPKDLESRPCPLHFSSDLACAPLVCLRSTLCCSIVTLFTRPCSCAYWGSPRTAGPEHHVCCTLLQLQHLAQPLKRSRCSVNICRVNRWRKTDIPIKFASLIHLFSFSFLKILLTSFYSYLFSFPGHSLGCVRPGSYTV